MTGWDYSNLLSDTDRTARELLIRATSADDLELFRRCYLGATGSVKELMGILDCVDTRDRAFCANQLNNLRANLDSAYRSRKSEIRGAA